MSEKSEKVPVWVSRQVHDDWEAFIYIMYGARQKATHLARLMQADIDTNRTAYNKKLKELTSTDTS